MPISPYLKSMRNRIGNDLIVLPSVSLSHVDSQGRLLLMHFADTGKWGLPGGCVEPHEQPAVAAVREMWEETGLFVKLTGLLSIYGGPEMHVEYPNGDQVSYVSTIFSCDVISGDLHARDGEALELAYLTEKEATDIDLVPWTRTLLPHLFGNAPTPFFIPNTWTPDAES